MLKLNNELQAERDYLNRLYAETNLLSEAAGIQARIDKGGYVSAFDRARFTLFSALINSAQGKINDSQLWEQLARAGNDLYSNGGMNDMKDPLLWLFIPRQVQRLIDNAWDGIGGWCS